MPRPTRFDWLFRPQPADLHLPLSAEARFAEALAGLPAVERSALALSEIGGLDVDEIAERLGTDPAVVRKLLARARESVRTSLSVRGRRGLTVLLPFQSLWQVGSSAPAVRAAGLVVAAVVAPTVASGGAAADAPRATLTLPDAPAVRAHEWSHRGPLTTSRVRLRMAGSAAAVAPTRPEAATGGGRRSLRPGAGLQRDHDPVAAGPPAPAPELPKLPPPSPLP